MSKERLEEARLMAEMLRVETRLPHDFPFDLVDWLVEQAERAQELEEELYGNDMQMGYKHMYGVCNRDYAKLLEQNKRYREVLKNIYELAEYDEYDNTLEQIVSEVEKALEE